MSAENWLFSVGSMLSTCNKVVQYSWKSSSKLQKTDNDIHNNLSDCGFAVWQFSVASALQSTVHLSVITCIHTVDCRLSLAKEKYHIVYP